MQTNAAYSQPLAERGASRVAADPAMAERLRWARKSAGHDTPSQAISAHDWERVYFQHESGLRGFVRHTKKYARAYRVREDWLRYGQGLPREGMHPVNIGGIVGPYGVINDLEKRAMPPDGHEFLQTPPGDAGEYVAYPVSGDHNYPALFKGDVIYAAKPIDPKKILGKQCVATLADGTKRICILALSAAVGRFILLSVNATPIPDAEVVEAAPIVWIKRG